MMRMIFMVVMRMINNSNAKNVFCSRCLLVVDECTQCSITVTFKGPSTFLSLVSHLHFLSMELHARFLLTVSEHKEVSNV